MKWIRFGIVGLLGFSFSGFLLADEAGPEYLKESISNSPLAAGFEVSPFLENQHWELHLRSYFLERNTDEEADKQALAVGGWITWKSGYWRDFIQFSATIYASQKAIGDSEKDGAGLLQPGQESYNGFSSIYTKLKLGEDTFLRLGRFEMNAPYVNGHDIRMTPNSFQGTTLAHKFNNNWDLGAGYLTRIKDRTSTDFEEAYDRAGLDGDDGVSLAGVRFHDDTGHHGGAYIYYAPDVFNMVYGEYSHHFQLKKNSELIISGQYSHQSSTGDELGGDLNGDLYGTKLVWKNPVITTTIAYTLYNGDKIISNWGAAPGYTSVMINDFNRVGEKAYLLGVDKDLAAWNLPGWHAGTNITTGDTDDSGQDASPDRTEWNLNLKYTFQTGALKGLSVFFRHVQVNEKNSHVAKDAKDKSGLRIITNYNVRF